MAVMPFVGDRFVPAPVKVLLALAVSIAIFPGLVASGQINIGEAKIWAATPGGLIGTVAMEAIFGLALGYVARLLFDAVLMGADLAGNFMGFAMASTYDAQQESNTAVVAEVQMAIAMLVFLVLDGHHLMLRSALDSYRVVGLGKAGLTEVFNRQLIDFTGQVLRFGIQIAAPIAVSMFTVNIAFGVISKTLPQLNVFVLSFAVSAMVGLVVLLLSISEFQTVAGNILGRIEEWMQAAMVALATK